MVKQIKYKTMEEEIIQKEIKEGIKDNIQLFNSLATVGENTYRSDGVDWYYIGNGISISSDGRWFDSEYNK